MQVYVCIYALTKAGQMRKRAYARAKPYHSSNHHILRHAVEIPSLRAHVPVLMCRCSMYPYSPLALNELPTRYGRSTPSVPEMLLPLGGNMMHKLRSKHENQNLKDTANMRKYARKPEKQQNNTRKIKVINRKVVVLIKITSRVYSLSDAVTTLHF